MVARTMWLTMLAIGVMAVSGLGFAAFTSTATATTNATAGTLNFQFGSASYVTSAAEESHPGYLSGCNAASTSTANGWPASTMTVSTGNFAPGDWCQVNAQVVNNGNIPGTFTVTPTVSATCASWNTGCTASNVQNCWQSYASTPSNTYLMPGGDVTVSSAIELTSFASQNYCEGSVGSLAVTISATSSSVSQNNEIDSSL